jgi:hypothetical protein
MAGSGKAQFAYDFGIAISQSTLTKLTRLTGASLTLASAFYALKSTASEYVDVLKENTIRLGGVLSTMQAMEQAQRRLVQGQSYFDVSDQLKGMNQLMSVGVKVGENLDWVSKAAHATGKSFAEFSGLITNAINGNLQGLVDAGFMTQRATKMFAKFQGNTVMMQNAVMNFLKTHKGLMRAIENDFVTIQDGTNRLKGVYKSFLHSVIGKPNDPSSLYGAFSGMLQMIGDKFGKGGELTQNMIAIKRYGEGIGMVLNWVVTQVGHTIVWLGKQAKKVTQTLLGSSDTFAERMRSFVVWLEFWKLRVVDFFKEYGNEIKGVLKLLIAYKVLKSVFVIGDAAMKSVRSYRTGLRRTFALRERYVRRMRDDGNKYTRWLQSLAVFLPRWARKIYVSVGKILNLVFFNREIIAEKLGFFLFKVKQVFGFVAKGLKFIFGLIRNIRVIIPALANGFRALLTAFSTTNPLGWIMLAVAAVVMLYNKFKGVRTYINGALKLWWEQIKLLWNIIATVINAVIYGLKWLWEKFKEWIITPFENLFSMIGDGLKWIWDKIKDSPIVKWLRENIFEPIEHVWDIVKQIFSKFANIPGKIANFFGKGNDALHELNEKMAAETGVNLAVKGGKYDENDSENYMDRLFGKKDEKTDTPNPLATSFNMPSDFGSVGGGNSGPSTNLSFGNGAIQIIVQNGEGIDENVLARKVKQVILDLKRDNNVRGGTL